MIHQAHYFQLAQSPLGENLVLECFLDLFDCVLAFILYVFHGHYDSVSPGADEPEPFKLFW